MLSKNQIKLINSLKFKKFRDKHDLFIAEGVKVVEDLLESSIMVKQVFSVKELIQRISDCQPGIEIIEVSEDELKTIIDDTGFTMKSMSENPR